MRRASSKHRPAPSNCDEKATPGTPVSFVVAADVVSLSMTKTDARNSFTAQLISEEFVGSMVTLFFEAEGGMEVKVQVQERVLEGISREPGSTFISPSTRPTPMS